MKKYILSILLVLAVFIAVPSVNAADKPKKDGDPINVYIFRGESCGYCHSALEWFQSIEDEYGDYFNLIGYEVSDENNSLFWQAVAQYFGDEAGGIPYIVIGDAYHAAGFEESMGEQLISIILEQYENDEYVDVVSNIAIEEGVAEETSYEENADFPVLQNAGVNQSLSGESSDAESSTTDTLIVIGIFVVLIGGIAGLVVASRK